jgi:hypothetical protein
MQAFRDALSDCELEDLGYSGNIFTWKRGCIRERLDRDVANEAWNVMHPGVVVQNLDYARSDHRPIMIDTKFQPPTNNRRTKAKHFEAKWFIEKNFGDVVNQAWEAAALANPSGGVLDKLGHMHNTLHAWDSSILQKPKKETSEGSK